MPTFSLPRYQDNLSDYIGDMRSTVYSSQSKAAHAAGVSSTTISRYEGGKLKPRIEYLLFLISKVGNRISELHGELDETNRATLLADLNEVIRWNYADQRPFSSWHDIEDVLSTGNGIKQRGNCSDAGSGPLTDWGDAPDIAAFVGRVPELSILQRFIVNDDAQIIAIMGMGGVGKTSLATKFVRQIANEFEVIFWRSVRNAPEFSQLAAEFLNVVMPELDVAGLEDSNAVNRALIKCFQRHRCVMVIDNLEVILHPDDPSGLFRPGYETYGAFIRDVGMHRHRSCIVLTSREEPFAIRELKQSSDQMPVLKLKGLTSTQARQLLAQLKLEGTDEEWRTFVETYSGNPLALKLSADTIRQFFARDIGLFLNSAEPIFGDIRKLLRHQLNRLSALALETMYWLVVECTPLGFDELLANLTPSPAPGDLIDTLMTLTQCSMVENYEGRFHLQNVVAEFVADYLLLKLVDEIMAQKINLMHRISLLNPTANVPTRQTQIRLFINPIKSRLASKLDRDSIEGLMAALLVQLRPLSDEDIGYAVGNIINLKHHLGLPFENDDYSSLPIRRADLRDASLMNVDFRGVKFSQTVFDNAFIGVNSVAVSPDSTKLLIAVGKEIWIWDRESLLLEHVLRDHQSLVWNLRFSADGHRLFSSSDDGEILVWNFAQLAAPELTMQDNPHRIWAMGLSADGSQLATGDDHGTIILWDAHTGAKLTTLSSHTSLIQAIAFSPTGDELAAAGRDRVITIWDLRHHRNIATLLGHTGSITSLEYTSNGDHLISGSHDNTVRVWHAHEKRLVRILDGHTNSVLSIKCGVDDQTLISSGADKTIRVWQLHKPSVKYVLRGHNESMGQLSIDRSGSVLVSGSYDRTACIWDLESGQMRQRIYGKTFHTLALAFDATEKKVASGNADNAVRVWELETGKCHQEYIGHKRWISDIAFSPTAHDLFASASYDRTDLFNK